MVTTTSIIGLLCPCSAQGRPCARSWSLRSPSRACLCARMIISVCHRLATHGSSARTPPSAPKAWPACSRVSIMRTCSAHDRPCARS